MNDFYNIFLSCGRFFGRIFIASTVLAVCVKAVSLLRIGGWEGFGQHSVVHLANAIVETWGRIDSGNLFNFMVILSVFALVREGFFPHGLSSLFKFNDGCESLPPLNKDDFKRRLPESDTKKVACVGKN